MALIKINGKIIKEANKFIKYVKDKFSAVIGRAIIGSMILGKEEE